MRKATPNGNLVDASAETPYDSPPPKAGDTVLKAFDP
jgi:hypothetical protein